MAEVEALQASPEAAPVESAPELVESADAAGEAAEPQEPPAVVSDHKRKYEELEAEEKVPEEPGESEATAPEVAAPASDADRSGGEDGVGDAEKEAEEPATGAVEDRAAAGDAKRQRLDEETEGCLDEGVVEPLPTTEKEILEPIDLPSNGTPDEIPAVFESINAEGASITLPVPAATFPSEDDDAIHPGIAKDLPQHVGSPNVGEVEATSSVDGGIVSLEAVGSDNMSSGNSMLNPEEEPSIGVVTSLDGGQQVVKLDAPTGNGQIPATENLQPTSVDKLQESVASAPQQSSDAFGQQPTVDVLTTSRKMEVPNNKLWESISIAPQQSSDAFGQQPTVDVLTTSRKMEVPNNKVGVLIGKSGETIRFLQFNSGAKIQITRDAEADPNSRTRTVELIGSVESVNKAEKLIKDVIAEADAGGSPSLVAKGFGIAQPGAEQLQIQVPNEKIGLIIGKGGETIKNLQTRSGARIQLVPQHLPEGGISKERTVRITGNMKQIEAATEMIKEVMNQVHSRTSSLSGGYTQQTYRPRGPTSPQWGPHAAPPRQQTSGYGYHQSGMYPSQAYHGYPPQGPRGSFGWDQRASAPVQTLRQMGGYDYYGQGSHPSDMQTSGPGPAPAAAGAPNPPVNYYGQPQAPGYGQPAPYSQSAPGQQGYGQGYDEPKYDNPAPTQQVYGQQPIGSVPGAYSHMSTTSQLGYAQQQPYNKQPQGPQPQSYGPARPGQPGENTYQGTPQAYGSTGPTQQSYLHGSGAAPQQASGYPQPYGMPTPSGTDGYAQQAANYTQQGGQAAPMYTQPAASYPQDAQTGGYGQYPSSQPGYGEQPVAAANAGYGYQGGSTVNAGYGANAAAATGYGVPPSAGGQAGYAQAPSNPSGYEQPPMAAQQQSGYGSAPTGAPVAYAQGVTPQPGNGQYDANVMYPHH